MTLVPGSAPATGFASGMTRAQYVAATIANYGVSNFVMLALADTAVITSGILADTVVPDIGVNWSYNAASAKKADVVTVGGRTALSFASATPTSYTTSSASIRSGHAVVRYTAALPPATERYLYFNTTGVGARASVTPSRLWTPIASGTLYKNNTTTRTTDNASCVIDTVAPSDSSVGTHTISRTGTTTAIDCYWWMGALFVAGFVPSAEQRAAQYALDKKYFSGIGLP